MKAQSVFVTGGTGFLGAYILTLLVSKGYKVKALKRSHSSLALVTKIKDKIEWLEGDISDLVLLDEAISSVDFVIHAAALVSFEKKDKEALESININGTRDIVNLCLAHAIKKLIHISSIASLGRGKDGDHINEASKWEESKLNSQYGISKYEGELEVWRGIAEGLPAIILNPSVILGMGLEGEGTMPFFEKFSKGFPFYSVGQTGFVDVRDVAELTVLSLESKIHSERYVVNGDSITYRHLFNLGAGVFGQKKPTIKVNKFLEALSWRLAAVFSFVTGKKPFLTKETAQHSSKTYFYEQAKSKETFNFEYRTIADCIKDTAQVYKQYKKTGKLKLLNF